MIARIVSVVMVCLLAGCRPVGDAYSGAANPEGSEFATKMCEEDESSRTIVSVLIPLDIRPEEVSLQVNRVHIDPLYGGKQRIVFSSCGGDTLLDRSKRFIKGKQPATAEWWEVQVAVNRNPEPAGVLKIRDREFRFGKGIHLVYHEKGSRALKLDTGSHLGLERSRYYKDFEFSQKGLRVVREGWVE